MSPFRAFRRRTHVSAATAVAVAGALLLSGCGTEQQASGGDQGFVQGTGQITKVPEEKRRTAPAIGGETVDGGEVQLSDYRGKVVVLNVWGSWCAPCRAEAPHLAEVARDMKDEGVRFLGINTRDLDKANAKAFERSFDVGYPSLYDPSGKQIAKFPDGTLPPQTIPSTLVLDREGRVAVQALKELGEKELRSLITPVLAEK